MEEMGNFGRIKREDFGLIPESIRASSREDAEERLTQFCDRLNQMMPVLLKETQIRLENDGVRGKDLETALSDFRSEVIRKAREHFQEDLQTLL